MIVVDASVVIEYLAGGRRSRLVEGLLLAEEDDLLQAPALIDLEVAQVLRRLARTGTVSAEHAGAGIEILQDMPLTRHASHPLLPRIWELRENLTAFDAAYVALAEALGCVLVTFDQRIPAAPGHTARTLVPGGS